MQRKHAFIALAIGLVAGGAWYATRSGGTPSLEGQEAIVHLDPGCGCCGKWITHMQQAGVTTDRRETATLEAVKTRLGVPATVRSCHTAEIGGYIVEGHVPADAVARLLREKPEGIVGIGVGGMPSGSPGMEVAGQPDQPYNIMVWDAEGRTRVFERR